MDKEIVAIIGPSGSGKTTLGFNLSLKNKIEIPRHVTTRDRRKDDFPGFYRYFTHDEYLYYYNNGQFIISSGDNTIISKKYGNFYGVLYNDCIESWKLSDTILLFSSYKDINTLNQLREKYDVKILNITFINIVEGMKNRLVNNHERNHTKEDIDKRIASALKDYENYNDLVQKYSDASIYTDILNIHETYEEACNILKLKK